MICDRCTDLGKKSVDVFTKMERMFILTSATSMLRHISKTDDKLVANSVVTKMLLSFDPASRDTLTMFLKKNTGMEISLKSCPHGVLSVV